MVDDRIINSFTNLFYTNRYDIIQLIRLNIFCPTYFFLFYIFIKKKYAFYRVFNSIVTLLEQTIVVPKATLEFASFRNTTAKWYPHF